MTFSSRSVTVFITKGGHLCVDLSKGSPKTKYNPVRSPQRNMRASCCTAPHPSPPTSLSHLPGLRSHVTLPMQFSGSAADLDWSELQ